MSSHEKVINMNADRSKRGSKEVLNDMFDPLLKFGKGVTDYFINDTKSQTDQFREAMKKVKEVDFDSLADLELKKTMIRHASLVACLGIGAWVYKNKV